MKYIFYSLAIFILSCSFQTEESNSEVSNEEVHKEQPCLTELPSDFQTGAEQIEKVLLSLKGKSVGIVGNPSSQVNGKHLVDVFMENEVALQRIFCPEHGFRGEGAAGASIVDSIDEKTGLPIVSLYGKNKKPSPDLLNDIDILVFDIQDVGARFYTYISTLHYIMEAAAETNTKVLILDRPNPNGHVVDGPILNPEFKSFIGMHPIPVCHGMTIAEYGQMINGEGWLTDGIKCDLSVIPCLNYIRNSKYELPIKPSPNLPSYKSILLYPSLCFFEGTSVSAGRGTDTPFEWYGHPKIEGNGKTFTPSSRKESPKPKLESMTCQAHSFDEDALLEISCSSKLNITELLSTYALLKEDFFSRPDFFDLLAGSDQFRKQILAGISEEEIRESWEVGLTQFKKIRSKHLLYP